MRNISAWAIRHPIFPLILFTVLTTFGVIAFVRLPINLQPDISAPFVDVIITQPGAAPTEIETQIMQKVEGAVASIGNVKHITSRAIEGQSFTGVEFQVGTPVDRAVNDVRDAVARVRSELPDGIQEPIVRREDIEGGAIAYLLREHHPPVRGAAVLVRRRHGHQAAAGDRRSRAGGA